MASDATGFGDLNNVSGDILEKLVRDNNLNQEYTVGYDEAGNLYANGQLLVMAGSIQMTEEVTESSQPDSLEITEAEMMQQQSDQFQQVGGYQAGQSTVDLLQLQQQLAAAQVAPSAPGAPQPRVEIMEQPQQKGQRFRYECEGRSAGSILGESTSSECKKYPSVKIHNCNSKAQVIVSLVTRDDPPRSHPHRLVGKDCDRGICTLILNPSDEKIARFTNLGIQCVKRKEIASSLQNRIELGVVPFKQATHSRSKKPEEEFEMNVVCLCFQVFLFENPATPGAYTQILPPMVSQPIFDKKGASLHISRIDKTVGNAWGGDEIFILCDKVQRDDIEVVFRGEGGWEAKGSFGPTDVHKQVAIVVRSPPYKDKMVKKAVKVQFFLRRPSDHEVSEPMDFTYQPLEQDIDGIEEKRKRKMGNFRQYTIGNQPVQNASVPLPLAGGHLFGSRPQLVAVRQYGQSSNTQQVAVATSSSTSAMQPVPPSTSAVQPVIPKVCGNATPNVRDQLRDKINGAQRRAVKTEGRGDLMTPTSSYGNSVVPPTSSQIRLDLTMKAASQAPLPLPPITTHQAATLQAQMTSAATFTTTAAPTPTYTPATIAAAFPGAAAPPVTSDLFAELGIAAEELTFSGENLASFNFSGLSDQIMVSGGPGGQLSGLDSGDLNMVAHTVELGSQGGQFREEILHNQ